MKGFSLKSLRKKIEPKPGSFSLTKKINAFLFRDVNRYFEGKARIKPSDMGSPCFRKIFYSYLRVRPSNKLTSDNKRIFDMGDAVHEMVRDWLRKTGTLVDYLDPKTGKIPNNKFTGKPDPEFPIVYEPLEIKKGKIDGILRIGDDIWIQETKGEKTEKFTPLKAPRKDHKIQTDFYVHLFEILWKEGKYDHIEALKGAKEVKGAVFIYVDKNTQKMKEYHVLKSEGSLDELHAKYKKFKGFIKRKELPPPVEDYCYFCPYNSHCKKNYNPFKTSSTKS